MPAWAGGGWRTGGWWAWASTSTTVAGRTGGGRDVWSGSSSAGARRRWRPVGVAEGGSWVRWHRQVQSDGRGWLLAEEQEPGRRVLGAAATGRRGGGVAAWPVDGRMRVENLGFMCISWSKWAIVG